MDLASVKKFFASLTLQKLVPVILIVVICGQHDRSSRCKVIGTVLIFLQAALQICTESHTF